MNTCLRDPGLVAEPGFKFRSDSIIDSQKQQLFKFTLASRQDHRTEHTWYVPPSPV